MTFSERYGHVKVRNAVQVAGLDEMTRRRIWNLIHATYLQETDFVSSSRIDVVFQPVWTDVFHWAADEYPGGGLVGTQVKRWIMTAEWFRIFDLIEGVAYHDISFVRPINDELTRCNVGYRLIDGKVIPISDTTELSEIEIAIGSEHEGTRHHLKQALDLLSDRDNPDYPNSIKESISAVESKAGQLTGKKTLGKALDELKRSGPYVHPSLIEGWKKIYGWVSDEDGLRHGGDSAPTPDQDLARYMLVTCSAFVNLLTATEAQS